MKKFMAFAASAVVTACMLSSCVTFNSGAALTEKNAIGQKMGEAKSTIILGLWSSQGESNNIKKAAENGGISKVTQVEYSDKSVFLGLWHEHTTRVYGE